MCPRLVCSFSSHQSISVRERDERMSFLSLAIRRVCRSKHILTVRLTSLSVNRCLRCLLNLSLSLCVCVCLCEPVCVCEGAGVFCHLKCRPGWSIRAAALLLWVGERLEKVRDFLWLRQIDGLSM